MVFNLNIGTLHSKIRLIWIDFFFDVTFQGKRVLWSCPRYNAFTTKWWWFWTETRQAFWPQCIIWGIEVRQLVAFDRLFHAYNRLHIYFEIFSEHFSLNTFSIDKRTHSYIKNVTEQCIIHHADLDLTNTICHNVFTCKEEKCALPFPTEEVIRQACSRLDFNYEKCNDLNQERCFIKKLMSLLNLDCDLFLLSQWSYNLLYDRIGQRSSWPMNNLSNVKRICSMISPMPNKSS